MSDSPSFHVGSMECTPLSDGYGLYEPQDVFADVTVEEAVAMAPEDIDENGMLRLPYTCLLVRSGKRLCLFDAGLGFLAPQFDLPAGRLVSSLEAVGVSPSDIDVVVISHGHGDHIGGLVSMESGRAELAFHNARHVFWRSEWEFWTSEANLSQMVEMFSGPARACLSPVAESGLLQLVEEETEILPGIGVISAPGHTPGHIAATIRSGEEEAIYLADTILHRIQIEQSDRVSVLDMDHEMTKATRRRLLERSAQEGSTVVAFHVSEAGRISKGTEGYRWSPLGLGHGSDH